MQVIMSIILLAGLGLFLVGILWMSVATVIDILTGGEDKQRALRKELWHMTGDPKDKP